MNSLYQFKSYKDYIHAYLKENEKSWGIKSRLSKALGIHGAYLTQVLTQEKHLTIEQIHRLADYLSLNDEAKDYLIYLALKDRSGTHELEKHFESKLEKLREKNLNVLHRLGKTDAVSEEDQKTYYSSWMYAAFHVALHIPELRNAGVLAKKFGVSERRTQEVLYFLIEKGFAEQKGSQILPTSKWIRLSRQSSWISSHHTNVRLRALERMKESSKESLHYSGYFSFSRDDFEKIKDSWLKTLEDTQRTIKNSPSEEVYCLDLDLFKLASE